MLLTSFIGKRVVVDKIPRCVCTGIAVSRKNGKLLYLLCSTNETDATSFALSFSSVISVNPSCIVVNKFRPCLCKRADVLFLDMPVYSTQGKRLGVLQNGHVENGVLIHITVNDAKYSLTQIKAVMDAILLSPSPVYPIGQHVPVSTVYQEKFATSTVTKALLKKAIERQCLIQFTLSLPPFTFS